MTKFLHQVVDGGHFCQSPRVFPTEQKRILHIAFRGTGQRCGDAVGNGSTVTLFQALITMPVCNGDRRRITRLQRSGSPSVPRHSPGRDSGQCPFGRTHLRQILPECAADIFLHNRGRYSEFPVPAGRILRFPAARHPRDCSPGVRLLSGLR